VLLATCAVTLMLVVGLPGCWNPFSPGHGDGGKPPNISRKDPDKLLEFFATKYEDKDAEGYAECLDEDYEFVFDQKDYDDAGVTPDKPYWGRTEDVAHTTKMFNAAEVKAILMDLKQKDMDWTSDTFATPTGGTVEGFYCLIKPSIDVTIEGKPGEEPVTKQVRNSQLYVAAIPDRHYAGLWTILKITETLIQ